MQKLVQKAVFAALLLSSSAFANGDLLSQATDGAVTTAKAEVVALSDGEMRDVKGGYVAPLFIPSSFNRYYGSTGTLTSSYSGAGSSYWYSNSRAVYTPVSTSSSIYARSFGTWYWGRTYPGIR
jgi:hypothetical protein